MIEQRMRTRNAENQGVVAGLTSTIPSLGTPQLRLGALLAVGLAVFLVGWLVLGGRDDGSKPANGASEASEAELRSLAASSSTPVYWAGPRDGQTYELTKTTDGRVYVRYLPEGVEVGDPRARFLTVGTYPRPNAWAELRRASREPGAVSRQLPNDGMMVFSRSRPTSVYVGFAGGRYQIEVYAPSPGSARKLVESGQIVPVR
jgi:hypothetical protein